MLVNTSSYFDVNHGNTFREPRKSALTRLSFPSGANLGLLPLIKSRGG